jgi:hypothetical protein
MEPPARSRWSRRERRRQAHRAERLWITCPGWLVQLNESMRAV